MSRTGGPLAGIVRPLTHVHRSHGLSPILAGSATVHVASRRERVSVTSFLNDLAVAGRLHAESRGLQLVIEPGDLAWAVTADPEVLASAVMNLLNNAFKFTPAGGRVLLRARTNKEEHLLIEVEDECGGIAASTGDLFQSFGERRGGDRTGLGLGLSIARKAVRAHGGDIHVHNIPDKGCVFTIEVPLAAAVVPVLPGIGRIAPAL